MLFDIICVIIIIAGLFFGFKRGFFAQAGSVMGVILGIICCNLFAEKLAMRFIEPGDSAESILLSTVLSYIVIFVCCYLVGRLFGSGLSTLFRTLHIGCVDRLGGAIFTMLEYTLVFSMILNAFVGAFPNTELRTTHNGVKSFVLNFAPRILGSETVNDVYDSVQTTIGTAADGLLDVQDTTQVVVPA